MKRISALAITALLLNSCATNTKEDVASKGTGLDTLLNEPVNNENPYSSLRSMALNTKGEDMGLRFKKGSTSIYGLVVDRGTDSAVVTTVAFITGDASFYTSTGNGVTGGGKYPEIRPAVSRLISASDSSFKSLNAKIKGVPDSTLPTSGHIVIHILTNKGDYSRLFESDVFAKTFAGLNNQLESVFHLLLNHQELSQK